MYIGVDACVSLTYGFQFKCDLFVAFQLLRFYHSWQWIPFKRQQQWQRNVAMAPWCYYCVWCERPMWIFSTPGSLSEQVETSCRRRFNRSLFSLQLWCCVKCSWWKTTTTTTTAVRHWLSHHCFRLQHAMLHRHRPPDYTRMLLQWDLYIGALLWSKTWNVRLSGYTACVSNVMVGNYLQFTLNTSGLSQYGDIQ